LPPNRISREMYDALPLPWTVVPPVPEFPESGFVRREWDRDGVLTDGKDFLGGGQQQTLDELERSLGTASMVTRWRDAYPELAYTERDCVRQTMAKIRQLLGEEAKTLRTGSGTALLMFKRR
jgi:trans-aconitate 3-methyltransferase